MYRCGICLEILVTPTALPCGHVFCSECIHRAVNAIKPYSTLHNCPTCRSSFTTATVKPDLIPAHLRPHLAPNIRKIYLDLPTQPQNTLPPTTEVMVENRRLNVENVALRTNCEMWRRRAELHGIAILNLLGFARMTRDQATKMRNERDDIYRHYNVLKRKLANDEPLSHLWPPPSATNLPHAHNQSPPSESSHVLLLPVSKCSQPSTSSESNELARPMKRARFIESSTRSQPSTS